MVGVTISPHSKAEDGSSGSTLSKSSALDSVKRVASDGTRWLTGLGVSKSIVQGEISVGGRFFDMEKEMVEHDMNMTVATEFSAVHEPTAGELDVVKNNHGKDRAYKDKRSVGTWLYLEIESCKGLGKADR